MKPEVVRIILDEMSKENIALQEHSCRRRILEGKGAGGMVFRRRSCLRIPS